MQRKEKDDQGKDRVRAGALFGHTGRKVHLAARPGLFDKDRQKLALTGAGRQGRGLGVRRTRRSDSPEPIRRADRDGERERDAVRSRRRC